MTNTNIRNQKFIGTTCGLNATLSDTPPAMTRVEYYETLENDKVRLQPVSGHNLSDKPGRAYISAQEFEARPINNVLETRWALKICGYDS